ncbi:MAG: NAD(P)-binding domain-containing protein [Planctomycetota bacterium]|nr:NAD(P)-binding domain-containing protein [Planctomycetota bacterium]
MRIGFIGTGGISEAMIRGLVGHAGYREPIFVSKRSANRSGRLAEDFQNVTVLDDNQELVDRSDWVVLAVLPGQAEHVVQDLKFNSTHTVISLVAGLELKSLLALLSPAQEICRLIPLPPIEYGTGPIPLFPCLPKVADFLQPLGTVIPVEDEACFTVFSACSALMANFFEATAWQARWMEEQGVPREEAARYASSLSAGLSALTTRSDPAELQSLSRECLTAGGLNEHVLNKSLEIDWFDRIRVPLEQVLSRLKQAGGPGAG